LRFSFSSSERNVKRNSRFPTLIFEQGQGYLDFDVFPIVGLEKTDADGDTLYIIYYVLPAGKKFEFSFYYASAEGGVIRFKNQPEMKWTKKKS
jgi:hypothetical protein